MFIDYVKKEYFGLIAELEQKSISGRTGAGYRRAEKGRSWFAMRI